MLVQDKVNIPVCGTGVPCNETTNGVCVLKYVKQTEDDFCGFIFILNL